MILRANLPKLREVGGRSAQAQDGAPPGQPATRVPADLPGRDEDQRRGLAYPADPADQRHECETQEENELRADHDAHGHDRAFCPVGRSSVSPAD